MVFMCKPPGGHEALGTLSSTIAAEFTPKSNTSLAFPVAQESIVGFTLITCTGGNLNEESSGIVANGPTNPLPLSVAFGNDATFL